MINSVLNRCKGLRIYYDDDDCLGVIGKGWNGYGILVKSSSTQALML